MQPSKGENTIELNVNININGLRGKTLASGKLQTLGVIDFKVILLTVRLRRRLNQFTPYIL